MRKSDNIFAQRTFKLELSKLMSILKYEKTSIHVGASFVNNASFYKTQFENVFITDFDIKNDKLLYDETFIIFNKDTNKQIKVSLELLYHSESAFEQIILEMSKK